MKPRILWCTEFSQLKTGYATYSREVLSRLHKTGKYDIMEYASYCSKNDQRLQNIPWKVFPILPEDHERAEYEANNTNQFGEWRFEHACMAHKPHCVTDLRDFWMCDFEQRSPFRPCYFWSIMPTVDAYPQAEQWLDTYANADAVLTYQDWSHRVLKQQGANLINLHGSAPPCAATVFRPLDKKQIKAAIGFDKYKIIGTVMRNQKRKLYPQLFQAFRKYLNQTKRNDVLLYCHTSYPDAGWDIPRLLLQNEISSKVLFTYICDKCHKFFPTFFNGALTSCFHCKQQSAHLVNVQNGVDDNILAHIYNSFDVYVQYANCFAKHQEILLQSGWTPIDKIQVGDIAWTQKGRWKQVVNVGKNLKYSKHEPIKEIKVYSDFNTIIATNNHKFFSYTNEDFYSNHSIRETIGNYIRKKKIIPAPTPKPISKLQPGDLLVKTINDCVNDVTTIDLAKYQIKSSQIKTSNRYIDVDENFCQFLGLYVSDGTTNIIGNNNSIRITCNNKDRKNIKLSYRILNKISKKIPQYNIYENRNAVNIEIYSAVLANYFITLGKFNNKHLPKWTIHLPKHKQRKILQGLFMGDGCYQVHKNISSYSTISKLLAQQIIELLQRQRISYNVHLHNRIYKFEVRGHIAKAEFDTQRQSTRNVYINNMMLYQIKSITNSNYNEDTWNIEVIDDHTVTTRISSANQSEGFGMPALEAASCGIPIMEVDYSAMSDILKKLQGIPIKVADLQVEAETGCLRAIPNEQDFIMQLTKLLNMPDDQLKKLGNLIRTNCLQHYNWDTTASKWGQIFDNINIEKYEQQWKRPAQINQPDRNIPKDVDNATFARWLITKVLCDPSKIGSYMEARLIRDLNYGFTHMVTGGMYFNEMSTLSGRPNFQPFDTQKAYEHMVNLCMRNNHWEQIRCR